MKRQTRVISEIKADVGHCRNQGTGNAGANLEIRQKRLTAISADGGPKFNSIIADGISTVVE